MITDIHGYPNTHVDLRITDIIMLTKLGFPVVVHTDAGRSLVLATVPESERNCSDRPYLLDGTTEEKISVSSRT